MPLQSILAMVSWALAGLVILLAVAGLVARVRYALARRRYPALIPDFRIAPTDAEIVVRGWERHEIDAILTRYRGLYEGGEPLPAIVEKELASGIELTFPNGIAAQMLLTLINYLHYPHDIDLTGRSIDARGELTMREGLGLPDTLLTGQRATIFIPPDDSDYDMVLIRTDRGETYRISFDMFVWRRIDD